MCLYPRLITNPKYRPNKKNGGNIPALADERLLYVAIGCGKCIECTKQKAKGWCVRLLEEINTDKTGIFVTLTFSNESIAKIWNDVEDKSIEGYQRDNEISRIAVRRFLERWRKKYKKSVKHFLITELGHNGTENIHLHGTIFTKHKHDIETIWGYGWVYKGYSFHEKTIHYITKYITKIDPLHKYYIPKIYCSKGIGANYINRKDSELNKYNTKEGCTKEIYYSKKGFKFALPIYYRNKIYSEDEREILWLEKLDKQERYVLGSKISISKGYDEYDRVVKNARLKNIRLGYGTDEINKNEKKYEIARRNINFKKRLKTKTN